jgi:multidrug efflux pump subunit AcrA (membrane-fusion protein)
MFARIFVTVEKHDSTQILPTQSVVSRNGKKFIFVVDKNNTAVMLPVSTGITNSDMTEILSPVIDKKIVTIGQHLLVDGSSVIVAPDSVKVSGKGDHE